MSKTLYAVHVIKDMCKLSFQRRISLALVFRMPERNSWLLVLVALNIQAGTAFYVSHDLFNYHRTVVTKELTNNLCYNTTITTMTTTTFDTTMARNVTSPHPS